MNHRMTFRLALTLFVTAVAGAGGSLSAQPGQAFDLDQTGPTTIQGSVSPDGETMVFASDYGGTLNLWLIGSNGRGMRQLTTGGGDDREPAWSPSDSLIAFASKRAGNFDIWTISPAASAPIQVTSDLSNEDQPAWSPDGSKIAFVSDRGGSNDIWLMMADGTGLTRVTSLPGQESHPSFSPDGERLVYSYTAAGSSVLQTVKLDGTGTSALTGGGFRDWFPSWSAAGIAFSSNRSGTFGVWVMNSDGSGERQVPGATSWDPAWTPNGRVTFTEESMGTSSIMMADLQTGEIVPITEILGFAVQIDIHPGEDPNPINLKSDGSVPVAILSSGDLDVPNDLVIDSMTFGRTGDEDSLLFCNQAGEDVNSDGRADLVCHFSAAATALVQGDDVAILRGTRRNGLRVEGRDSVKITPRILGRTAARGAGEGAPAPAKRRANSKRLGPDEREP